MPEDNNRAELLGKCQTQTHTKVSAVQTAPLLFFFQPQCVL